MHAIQIQTPGDISALAYTTVPCPTLSSSHVLIKVAYAGVNLIDIYERSGQYPRPMPAILGREGSGEIIEVGAGNGSDFKIGDRVAFLSPGGYAEMVAVEAALVVKIPDSISLEKGAAVLLQGLTAWSLVRKAYNVRKGDWVVVHAAAGGVGLLLTQMCHILGAHVIGTTSNDHKASIAKAFGAEHVVLYTKGYDSLVDKVKELTGGKGVHVVFDGVGQASFDASLNVVRRLGTVVLFGSASGPVPPLNLMRLAEKNVSLLRTNLMNYIATREELNELAGELLEMVAQDRLQLSIHKVYPIQDAYQAHADIEGGKTTGKLLLKV